MTKREHAAIYIAAFAAVCSAISAAFAGYHAFKVDDALAAPFLANTQDRQIVACADFRTNYLRLIRLMEYQHSLDAEPIEPTQIGEPTIVEGEKVIVELDYKPTQSKLNGIPEFQQSLIEFPFHIANIYFFSGPETRSSLADIEKAVTLESLRNQHGRRKPFDDFINSVYLSEGYRLEEDAASGNEVILLPDTIKIFETLSRTCDAAATGEHRGLL